MSGHWFIVVCAYTNHKVSYMYMFEAGMHNGGRMVTEVEVGNTHDSTSFRDHQHKTV